MATRRDALGLGLSAVAAAAMGRADAARAAGDPLLPLWEAWKSRHLGGDGRVVDGPQGAISHSEGQAYAMVIAAALGDRDGFEAIATWTRENLAVRDDALLAWKWQPGSGERVPDTNNASDGDLFHAWALVRAAERFDAPALRERARPIATDLARTCIVSMPGDAASTVMLPGAQGFRQRGGLVLNPAYWCPRAMYDVGAATGVDLLSRCAADSVAHLAVLSRDTAPPDWTLADEDGFGPAPEASHAFGYEALRVPLYLVWSGLSGHPAVRRSGELWHAAMASVDDGLFPVVIDRESASVAETSVDPGYRALPAILGCGAHAEAEAEMPAFSRDQPYYPATLHLMALIADREAQSRC